MCRSNRLASFAEFDLNGPPALPERVMSEKRQKLRETLLRVLGMYKREEENEKFEALKKYGLCSYRNSHFLIFESFNLKLMKSVFRQIQEYDSERMVMEQNFSKLIN